MFIYNYKIKFTIINEIIFFVFLYYQSLRFAKMTVLKSALEIAQWASHLFLEPFIQALFVEVVATFQRRGWL